MSSIIGSKTITIGDIYNTFYSLVLLINPDAHVYSKDIISWNQLEFARTCINIISMV